MRERVIAALSAEPGIARIVNQGVLEDELWTDETWQDEYADELERELTSMVAEGILLTAETYGERVYGLNKEKS